MDNRIYDEIRNKVDIVEIIGNYIPLTRVGKNFRGLCPFHNDGHPSLTVSPDKQIYKCFSCGASGNVFNFVSNYEKISFQDAVRKVCALANIVVPRELEVRIVDKPVEKYQKLYDLMNDLTTFYGYQLKIDPNSEANLYLNSRNLSSDDIEYFKIGYSPESGQESISYLRSKGYSDDEIISCGVGTDLGKGNIIDRLRGRVIFSICNHEGKVVAFSGRRLKEGLGEKYVNSPETVLFHKTSVLYNYHNAMINSKKDGYCYIVEGFMDAIALHKSGIKHVVATMGTAFTDNHIKLLNQLRCELRLLFDADNPGQIATNKCIDSLMGTSLNFKVVVPLSDSKDIDELLQSQGKEAVINKINNLESVIQYKINYFSSNTNLSNHEECKKFVYDCVNFMSKCELDEMDLDYYCQYISKLTKYSLPLIKNEYKKLKKNSEDSYEDYYIDEPVPYETVIKHLDKYSLADHQILQMMIASQLAILDYQRLKISLSNRVSRKLANLIIDKQFRNEEISYASLFNEADEETAKLLGDLTREEFPETKMEVLADIVGREFLEKLDKDDLVKQLMEETDPAKKALIGQKLIDLNKRK